MTSPKIFGTVCYHKQRSHSILFGNQMQCLQFQHMHTSADHLIKNKMPLTPMGCEAQIHEKTDKQGTWAYHSVDGWYLFTSPEHYCTHTYYVKATKSKRHLDTAHFKHKNITNPTITHANKVMQALAECVKTITGAMGGTTAQEAKDLQCTVKATWAALHKNAAMPSTELQGCPNFRGCTHFRGCPLPLRTIIG
jgi:hypothetical protein